MPGPALAASVDGMEALTAEETLAELEKIEHTRELMRWMRGQFAQTHAEQLAAAQRGDAVAALRAGARDAALSELLSGIARQLTAGN